MTRLSAALGLLKPSEIRKQDPEKPALKKYFMHGVGHPIGLDVHDVGLTTKPIKAGWVMTVEPGIYLRDEGFAVRLEDNILVTDQGPVNLMASIPIDPDEIEALMNSRSRRRASDNGTGSRHHGRKPAPRTRAQSRAPALIPA